ncbi:MAG: iron-containing alcohol dehydrogenase [Marinilabiliaceae bacterium]|nr:iron-containing alcohol dehydrogenase [Marinilabiliaceae bacterium]
MVTNFSITKLPSVNFGIGTINILPGLIDSSCSTIVLITGNNTIERSNKLQEIIHQLKTKSHVLHYKIKREPSPNDIDTIVRDTYDNKAAVISIGGGSVIDAGKAISAMIPLKENITEYLEIIGSKKHPGIKNLFIAIPTTSGTGSEASANAVISKVGIDGFKRSLRHPNFVPDYVILDPQLTLDCPLNITAQSGMDALTQLTEAYVSTKSNRFTDSLIENAFFQLDDLLTRTIHNGNDIEARTALMYAAYISGIALANAGLGLVHGFASEIGGRFIIPHGAICAKLCVPCHEINVKKAIELNHQHTISRYSKLYDCLSKKNSPDESKKALLFIERIKELTQILKIPGFAHFGIQEKDIHEIAAKSELKNNPIDISYNEKIQILIKCL